ncbi:MAG: hypothetical protein D6809_04905, partial [Gammaproteobacteria bacterium]
MSLGRLAALALIGVALAVLLAAAVADRLATRARAEAAAQEAQAWAQAAAARLEARLAAARGALRALAWEPGTAAALAGGRARDWEARHRGLLDGAVRLRLLPASAVEAAPGPFPGLGFADLAMLREAARGAAPPAEAHLWGTPQAHLDLVEPLPGPREGAPPPGFLLASYPPAFLEGALGAAGLPAGLPPGRLELRQAAGGRATLLLAHGEEPARALGAFRARVAGTRWELVYRPWAPGGAPALWPVFGVLFLALAVLLLLVGRTLAGALRADLQALIGLMRGLQAGEPPEEPRARLREVQGALDVLASLGLPEA